VQRPCNRGSYTGPWRGYHGLMNLEQRKALFLIAAGVVMINAPKMVASLEDELLRSTLSAVGAALGLACLIIGILRMAKAGKGP
jgi:hypothetical protein